MNGMTLESAWTIDRKISKTDLARGKQGIFLYARRN
jgi:hypothetical protein